MKKPTPQAIHLKDYQVPAYLVDTVDLCFQLKEEATEVSARLKIFSNPKSTQKNPALVLSGENMELLSVALDGEHISPSSFEVTESSLTIANVPQGEFILETKVKITPESNTALEGLYKSSGIYCTQCEAEGFRRITYFIDRPDVMAKYTVQIEADKQRFPILLSNGNLVDKKDLGGGRHWVKWDDPFRKPCYLFALVAGDLGKIEDRFKTKSGREVKLEIYSSKGNEKRCFHAMDSLKKSMRWDEERFGLEYDLDVFMIVAVDDFNAGAMENKGLNIFNAHFVLADASTATDDDYNGVEAVVAHEYFHNWTGNRVTCRDWFQLSLKEGLTVYRDQEFTSDMMSAPVKRIEDVCALRTLQFSEDASPMAHPVRPQSYIEINNFYTVTVYEKGAEVIRMIATIIGREKFRRGIEKYFELFDGQAVTTDDFVHAMEAASGTNLAQFKEWYNQAGTPRVKVSMTYEEGKKRVRIFCEQSCPPTPEQPSKRPFHIPLAVGLLDGEGKEITSRILEIKKQNEEFVIDGVVERPRLSLHRGFSAPIYVEYPHTDEELLFLLANDSDSFARWEAGQKFFLQSIKNVVSDLQNKRSPSLSPSLLVALGKVLDSNSIDGSLKAQLLSLPSEEFISQEYSIVPIDEIHVARDFVYRQIASAHEATFLAIYRSLHDPMETYRYSAKDCAKRTLKNTALRYLCMLEKNPNLDLALEQTKDAKNMTDEMGALNALNDVNCAQREKAIAAFYQKWQQESLVMNKWFRLQAQSDVPGALDRVQRLKQDKQFSMSNPNKVRSLLVAFGYWNRVQFNDRSGEAYRFFADQVLEVDSKNPQLAAGMMRCFQDWKRLDFQRQGLVRVQLERMIQTGKLSPNVYEKVSKFLE